MIAQKSYKWPDICIFPKNRLRSVHVSHFLNFIFSTPCWQTVYNNKHNKRCGKIHPHLKISLNELQLPYFFFIFCYILPNCIYQIWLNWNLVKNIPTFGRYFVIEKNIWKYEKFGDISLKKTYQKNHFWVDECIIMYMKENQCFVG